MFALRLHDEKIALEHSLLLNSLLQNFLELI